MCARAVAYSAGRDYRRLDQSTASASRALLGAQPLALQGERAGADCLICVQLYAHTAISRNPHPRCKIFVASCQKCTGQFWNMNNSSLHQNNLTRFIISANCSNSWKTDPRSLTEMCEALPITIGSCTLHDRAKLAECKCY